MNHLGNLRIANRIYAGLTFLVVGLFAVVALLGGMFDSIAGIVPFVLIALFTGFGIFYWVVGDKVVNGRWRIAQTILAVLNIGNFPLGTAYGGYALWVCWFNDETKQIFDNPDQHLGDQPMF